jgi:hypothetical protein
LDNFRSPLNQETIPDNSKRVSTWCGKMSFGEANDTIAYWFNEFTEVCFSKTNVEYGIMKVAIFG